MHSHPAGEVCILCVRVQVMLFGQRNSQALVVWYHCLVLPSFPFWNIFKTICFERIYSFYFYILWETLQLWTWLCQLRNRFSYKNLSIACFHWMQVKIHTKSIWSFARRRPALELVLRNFFFVNTYTELRSSPCGASITSSNLLESEYCLPGGGGAGGTTTTEGVPESSSYTTLSLLLKQRQRKKLNNKVLLWHDPIQVMWYNSLIIDRQNLPITSILTEFTLGSWKDFDVGLLLIGSKEMLRITSFKLNSNLFVDISLDKFRIIFRCFMKSQISKKLFFLHFTLWPQAATFDNVACSASIRIYHWGGCSSMDWGSQDRWCVCSWNLFR